MSGKITFPSEVKRWGVAYHVPPTGAKVAVLRVDEGGYSSQHRHTRHANTLVSISGDVVIQTLGTGPAPDRGESRNHVLQPGEAITVPAGTWHRFICYGAAIVLEWYRSPEPGAEYDIERHDTGGVN